MGLSRGLRTRFALGLMVLATLAGFVPPTEGWAQTTIEIPPHEFERSIQRFDLSTMSQEETMNLMGMLFKSVRGGAGELSPEVVTAEASAAPPAPAGAAPAPQTVAVFPQIPPAVSGTKQALGRWMMFQANLLQRIGEVYALYGEELLAEAAVKPASVAKPRDAAKAPEAKATKK